VGFGDQVRRAGIQTFVLAWVSFRERPRRPDEGEIRMVGFLDLFTWG